MKLFGRKKPTREGSPDQNSEPSSSSGRDKPKRNFKDRFGDKTKYVILSKYLLIAPNGVQQVLQKRCQFRILAFVSCSHGTKQRHYLLPKESVARKFFCASAWSLLDRTNYAPSSCMANFVSNVTRSNSFCTKGSRLSLPDTILQLTNSSNLQMVLEICSTAAARLGPNLDSQLGRPLLPCCHSSLLSNWHSSVDRIPQHQGVQRPL